MSWATNRVFAAIAAVSMALILCAGASAFFPPVMQAPGRWVKLAPFPEPGEEWGTAAINGKLYVFGGTPPPENPTMPPKGLVYEYDAASDKWTKKKNMPFPAHHVAAIPYHGKIYVIGGSAQTVLGTGPALPTSKSWEYDGANDSWKELAPMPTARTALVAAEVGGKIFVISGFAARSVGTNEAYDPAANKWESRQAMPSPRNHAAIGAVNGKIYVIGGRIGPTSAADSSNVDLVEEYDPAADKWSAPKARMPTPMSGSGFGVYNGKIYVGGGEAQDWQAVTAFRAFEAYDPVADRWSILPSLAVPRHGPASAVIGNRIYFVSGHIQSGDIGGSAADIPDNDAFEFVE